jgi:sugar/nucleoside kinase (ribokinase family)
LSKLDTPSILGSAIGRDQAGLLVRNWLADTLVDQRGLVEVLKSSTPTTTVITDRALNRLAFHNPGATTRFNLANLPDGLLEAASLVLFASYPLLPAWRPTGVAQAFKQARQGGAQTALDIGPAIGQPTMLAELRALLPDVDYLICNAHELAVCTGYDTIEAGLDAALAAGANSIIVKCGEAGALIRQAGAAETIDVPGYAVAARFTVGAGDAFNAGLLYGLQTGWSLAKAVRFANGVAALVVSSGQGILGAPDLQRVEAFMQGRCT